jgi:hypothetical protein
MERKARYSGHLGCIHMHLEGVYVYNVETAYKHKNKTLYLGQFEFLAFLE